MENFNLDSRVVFTPDGFRRAHDEFWQVMGVKDRFNYIAHITLGVPAITFSIGIAIWSIVFATEDVLSKTHVVSLFYTTSALRLYTYWIQPALITLLMTLILSNMLLGRLVETILYAPIRFDDPELPASIQYMIPRIQRHRVRLREAIRFNIPNSGNPVSGAEGTITYKELKFDEEKKEEKDKERFDNKTISRLEMHVILSDLEDSGCPEEEEEPHKTQNRIILRHASNYYNRHTEGGCNSNILFMRQPTTVRDYAFWVIMNEDLRKWEILHTVLFILVNGGFIRLIMAIPYVMTFGSVGE